MRFYEDDIAVIDYQGTFPEALDIEEFYENLLKGKTAFRDLNQETGNYVETLPHFSRNKKQEDRLYSSYCTQIPLQRIFDFAQLNNLSIKESTGIEIILHELLRRFSNEHNDLTQQLTTECVIGMATGDPFSHSIKLVQVCKQLLEEFPESLNSSEQKRIEDFLKKTGDYAQRDTPLAKDIFTPLIFSSVKERFNISGACSFVDAACASSLAAISVAVSRLRSHQADLVVTGGIDIGLSNVILIAFSKCQVLSEKIMNPFDKRADGMNQGEAAALFFLTRLETAKRLGLKIHGVIRNCEGASDGINGGLTEPTERGQVLAYERTYRGVTPAPLSYLECHGTGTKIGDKTELASAARFFHPLPKLGSVKANIGHTIGAAGASSLAKALKIIETKKIPGMPNLRFPQEGFSDSISRHSQSLDDQKNLRVGVSSFGFGGTNFHLVVDEYREEVLAKNNRNQNSAPQFLLNAQCEIDLEYIHELLPAYKSRIPPVSLPYFDKAILGAVVAVDQMFKDNNIHLSQALREKIGVISTSNGYLDKFTDYQQKIRLLEIKRRLDPQPRSKNHDFIDQKLEEFLVINEDSLAGSLNNLIAGKITKDFDLKGPNFNIACEKASLGAALSYANSLLNFQSGAFIIAYLDENLNSHRDGLTRKSIQIYLVSDRSFALKANLPIVAEIRSKEKLESAYATHLNH